ncbi:MAG: hypothetical protein JNM99_10635 [Verrucomicrobiaceae bacterium]|nr:hypothetical protein [Verrucomicrobiaceae bacterium]
MKPNKDTIMAPNCKGAIIKRGLRVLFGGAALLALGLSTEARAERYGTANFSLAYGKMAAVSFTIPSTASPANGGAATFGVEVSVFGDWQAVCGVDSRGYLTSPSSCSQQFFTNSPVMIGNGFPSGSYTVYVKNMNLNTASQSFSLAVDVKRLRIYPQTSTRRLGSWSKNWMVIHGRADNESSFQSLAGALESSDSTAAAYRFDWSEAAAANFPSDVGLQGSKYIRPLGIAAASILKNAGVSSTGLSECGHSWGSHCSQQVASQMGSNSRSLVALDPAETTYLAGLIGNSYSGAAFSSVALRSLSMVTRFGLYGGESEAATSNVAIFMDVHTSTGKSQGDNGILHGIPVSAFNYCLRNTDSTSKSIVATALGTTGALTSRVYNGEDYRLTSVADGRTYVRHTSLVAR